jgi:26S proteasome regulatory subunit N11
MLKHGRAGVPMEVMGLMLGQFVDDYTITCVDVFAMPQHGTGVSVEAVDPVYQTDMMAMLEQTQRKEVVVGWYHSHPGFGVWMSQVDIGTQASFEKLHPRCVAVVIDPIRSVKGKVEIDAFRLISQDITMSIMAGQPGEPRQTTSNVGFMKKKSMLAIVRGLDKTYYSLVIDWRKNELEEQMLMNLHRKAWSEGLLLSKFEEHRTRTEGVLSDMASLSKMYVDRVKMEDGKTVEEVEVSMVGKVDPRKGLEASVEELMNSNIVQCLGTMLSTVIFATA